MIIEVAMTLPRVRDLNRVRTSGRSALALAAFCLAASLCAVLAADVTRPAEVAGLQVSRDGPADVRLAWDVVSLDSAGLPETVSHYNVYRGLAPDFVPDRAGGSNRIGSPSASQYMEATGRR